MSLMKTAPLLLGALFAFWKNLLSDIRVDKICWITFAHLISISINRPCVTGQIRIVFSCWLLSIRGKVRQRVLRVNLVYLFIDRVQILVWIKSRIHGTSHLLPWAPVSLDIFDTIFFVFPHILLLCILTESFKLGIHRVVLPLFEGISFTIGFRFSVLRVMSLIFSQDTVVPPNLIIIPES